MIDVRDSLTALAGEGTRRLAALARAAIAERGRFVMSVSGGTTPAPLYDRLADPRLAERVDWSKVVVFWADDRWVPHDHPDSNVRLVREHWLSRAAVPPGAVYPPPSGGPDPEAAAAAYERTIREVLGGGDGPPAFDLHLLGVGEDGHTASLFPGSPALAETRRLVAAPFVPRLGAHRLTLTLPALEAGREVWVLAVGARKAPVVRRAIEEADRPIGPETLPVARLRPAGRLVWLLDQAAAAELPPDRR